MFELTGKYTTAKVMIDNLEAECISQITSFLNHHAFTEPVAIMPDAHAGKGSCVGFTMPMTQKIIANIIGVDIGCGMWALRLGKELKVSNEELDHKIRSRVPFGFNTHDDAIIHMKNDFPWREANNLAVQFAMAYQNKFGIRIEPQIYSMDWLLEKCETIGVDAGRVIKSVGTLGSGNHFVEIGVDDDGNHWLTIHTGSRKFGERICTYWQAKAEKLLKHEKREKLQEEIQQIKQNFPGRERKQKIEEARQRLNLNDDINFKQKEWLEGELATGYLFDMVFAQLYAEVNRKYIARTILDVFRTEEDDKIVSVHNFIDFKDFVIRKGAIRSYVGERMIIPFNMRDGILLCEGKSNPDWNYSAPHGAGRVMSRSKAKSGALNFDEFKEQMEGIFSTSVCKATLDEAPGAYKDSKIIEEAIQPTANILKRIKPVHNMKDNADNAYGKHRKGKRR